MNSVSKISLAAAGAGLLLAAAPSSAEACSCIAPVLADQLESSQLVFVGAATARNSPASPDQPDQPDSPDEMPAGSLAGLTIYTFTIERVFKGEGSGDVQVATASNSAACGSNFEIGASYVIFANVVGGELRTGLCSGNATATPALIQNIEAALGADSAETPPEGETPPVGEPGPAPLPPPANKGNPACGGCQSSSSKSGSAALLCGLVGLGWLTARRRRNP